MRLISQMVHDSMSPMVADSWMWELELMSPNMTS